MTVLVREIMAPTPITARPETSVRQVAQLMRDEDIGVVMIADGTQLLGVVTDRDLVVRTLAAGIGAGTPVREVCSDELWSVGPDLDVIEAAEIMRNQAVRRLPVVENGAAIGVLSLGDIATLSAPDSVLGGISSKMPNT
ncbi:MAG TPA: CBS domain-containing protein [Actinospica sp.]|jgi:signal-transduction protein with cAMP-binding, CBS, and nucleotidyltransferase domain|nr:CBS domain-containing protein [Actinospica sp.]